MHGGVVLGSHTPFAAAVCLGLRPASLAPLPLPTPSTLRAQGGVMIGGSSSLHMYLVRGQHRNLLCGCGRLCVSTLPAPTNSFTSPSNATPAGPCGRHLRHNRKGSVRNFDRQRSPQAWKMSVACCVCVGASSIIIVIFVITAWLELRPLSPTPRQELLCVPLWHDRRRSGQLCARRGPPRFDLMNFWA